MKTLLIGISILISGELLAQQLFAEMGRTITVFQYTNSEGDRLNNIHSIISPSYMVGYRQQLKNKINLFGSIVYNNYEAVGSDEVYNNSYSWTTRYIGGGVGAEGDLFKLKRLSFMIRGTVEPQFFLSGFQTINGQVYPLNQTEEFERPFIFFRGGAGLNYCIENRIAITGRYMIGKGLPVGTTDSAERLTFLTHNLSIGILVSLNTCDYCYTKHFK